MISKLNSPFNILVAVLFSIASLRSGECHCQQTTTAIRPAIDQELDSWRGSSLGIRLEFENQIPMVSDIYEHVSDSSPFLPGDKIVQLGELKFPESSISDLSDLLNRTDPETNLLAVVTRNESELRLNLNTFRKEYVDIQAIYRRLSKNKIIRSHLDSIGRQSFFDDFTDRMATSVQRSKSPREAAEALNHLIDEIGVSHTAIIPASAGLSFSAKAKGSIGIVLQRHELNGRRGYFVIDRKPGSPAYDSELNLGDEVLSVNGIEIEKSRRLDLSGHEDHHQLFAIESDIGEELEIEFLRSPFDDCQTVRVRTEQDPGTVDSVRASSRVIDVGEQKIGYLRFWNLMSMGVNAEFNKNINENFASCDAIVMDLRGRGGIVPAVLSLNRSVEKMGKPLVAVIDGQTRSAKEMLAYLLKKQEHVLVVGSTTAGAVTGASMFQLPSGNSLMIPVASADSLKRFIDGTILEGVGVEPDEFVEYFVPYSSGQDRILNTALKRAAELSKAEQGVAGIRQ